MEGNLTLNNNAYPVVLMYHGILSSQSLIPNDRETGAELYDVSINDFKTQMKWLKENQYAANPIETTNIAYRDKTVVITFDDGEMNNFQAAFPILKELGYKAYFFIIVKRIGKNGYMGWEELKKLAENGMIIGSHGLTHEILTNLLDSQMEEELRASKRTLEINLGIPVDTISIPRGFCNDKVIQAAYRLGYKHVFISDRPTQLKSECLTRIAIKTGWSIKRFDLALKNHIPFMENIGNMFKRGFKFIFRESGYNWVRSVLIKLFK